ncbi:MAG: SPFH/Band 7/PHB domain protein [Christensenellaceae bacterium]|jgi:regulator of protease activity HflC (stomatin/prohibitin superfamily)|nr:SPFH/Band 7/PHB domain protein [Christensenellaceae bacterium]
MGWIIGIIIVLVVIAIILIASIRIVKQSTAVVVERLGVYKRTMQPGLRFLVPFIDRRVKTISLKEMVADFKPQPVITKDNVTMQIDTVVYYQVTDPKLFTYGVDRPISAIENLTATTLRNIVGELELDQTLTSRDTVNAQMRIIIDEVTDAWGIKVNRVELKNILPPRDIQESMEKQMRAERERRESILRAEGEKQSQILVAEGEKAAAVLRAEAKRISLLTEAEGQAEAIRRIIAAKPDAAYLTLQGFEALRHLANGEATKIIVPSNIQDVAGLLTSMTEVLKSPSPEPSKKVVVAAKPAAKQSPAKK